MNFKSQADVKVFGKTLQERLLSMGEASLANELREWDGGFFTTSSEFLGEMKLILEKISVLKSLDDVTKKNVQGCLSAINQAFGQ